jgi:hypothetical protein
MTARLLGVIAGLFALRLAAYALVEGLHPALAEDYCVWDCVWYTNLAHDGYAATPPATPFHHGQANWAFFPLFPLLLRGLASVPGISYAAAGLVIANLCFVAFVVLAVNYLPHRRPNTTTDRAALAVFLLAFPYSVYFSLPYTESLFALLTLAALYAASTQRLSATAGLAALASATRVPGALLAPLVAVRALAPAVAALRGGDHRRALACTADALLPIAIAPLGLFVFMAYLYAHMGDALAFAHVQVAWGRHTVFPLTPLVTHLLDHDWDLAFDKSVHSTALMEYAALAGFAVCVRLGVLRLWPECWLLTATLLLALSAGLVSMQRFVFANPVFLLFLFDWLWQSALFRLAFLPLMAGCAALQLYFVHCWLGHYAFLN